MRKLLFSLALIFFAALIHAQSAKSVYFELGGPGLASFNFDTRFKGMDGLGARIGVGGFSIKSDGEKAGVVFVPVGLNYLLGKDQKNYFEIGAGVTPVFGSGDTDADFSGTFGHLSFGYRLQPSNGGFTFRAAIVPVFGSFGFIPYYAGVSFGYAFGTK